MQHSTRNFFIIFTAVIFLTKNKVNIKAKLFLCITASLLFFL